MEQLTTKQYNKWYKLALVVSEGDDYYAGEVMQAVMIKLLLKTRTEPTFEITDGYVFVSLKNTLINIINKEKTRQRFIEVTENNDDSIDNIDEDKDDNEIMVNNQLKAIDAVAQNLNYFDKQLFILHFVNKKSQRQIARETDITLSKIHLRITKIKTKIKEYYQDEKNNR